MSLRKLVLNNGSSIQINIDHQTCESSRLQGWPCSLWLWGFRAEGLADMLNRNLASGSSVFIGCKLVVGGSESREATEARRSAVNQEP